MLTDVKILDGLCMSHKLSKTPVEYLPHFKNQKVKGSIQICFQRLTVNNFL